jgi:hypothetical protein
VASQDDEALGGDETQIRLLDWRQGQTPSEYLAALILDAEGYKDIDPSHPLGGPDGGRDGHCTKNGEPWTWAVYFPRGQQDLKTIKSKLKDDVAAALKHNPKGVAFVTNQELKLAERKELCALSGDLKIDLFHLYRVATILDRSQMAQIRQQYLRIGAGRPPVRVKAEVIGAARVFTSDDELFERFVAIYEKDTREESDKGWAVVKAEEEKKARAEAAKVRAEAEKARAEALQARDKNRPISLAELAQASMPSSFQNIAAGFNIQDVMPKFDFPKYEPVAATLLAGGRYGVSKEPPPPPKALSDEEIDAMVANYRAKIEARWEACKEYLAATTWPGLKFRIHNVEGFLSNVQVVLTFHGATGLDHEYIESFVFERLEDPSWTEPVDPYGISVSRVAPPLLPSSLKDYPVKWEHNGDGDLIVKITLGELRPHEVWSSDDDDIVLMMRDENLDSVQVTYTVTAYEYHDRTDGEPFTVPIEKVDIFDSLKAGFDATKSD